MTHQINTGCTEKHSFIIPFKPNEISAVSIVYEQNDRIVLKKTLKDCDFEGNEIFARISQEESLIFEDNRSVNIQLKIRLIDGTVTKSKIIQAVSDELIEREVI